MKLQEHTQFIITGRYKLKGTVRISGAKNAALPCLFATLLTDEPVTLYNVPRVADIDTTFKLLTELGKKIVLKPNKTIILPIRNLKNTAPFHLFNSMRASVLAMGPLLVRKKEAVIPMPGGCAIGSRPINFHISGLEQLGAKSELTQGMVKIHAGLLTGTRIIFPNSSVGATENLLMAATLIPGETVLENAAMEPEITNLTEMLIAMGAKIVGLGTSKLSVLGVDKLKGVEHFIIPDRIETGTFMIMTAATQGETTLTNVNPTHLTLVIDKIRQTGMKVDVGNDTIKLTYTSPLRPVDVETTPYPGFPTDLQSLWTAFMCIVPGRSIVRETIFENRFVYVADLRRLGAKIDLQGNSAVVEGTKSLSGAPVVAPDLRAGAALVLLGLVAQGKTTIDGIHHLDRGYEQIETKLRKLGAKIRRVKTYLN